MCIVIFIHYQNDNCYAFAVIAIINSLSNIPCLLLLILLLLRLISTVMSVLIIKFYPGQRRQLQTGWPYGTSVLAASSVPDSKTYYDISRGPMSTCSLYCEAKVDPFTKIMLPAVKVKEILNVCACVYVGVRVYVYVHVIVCMCVFVDLYAYVYGYQACVFKYTRRVYVCACVTAYAGVTLVKLGSETP